MTLKGYGIFKRKLTGGLKNGGRNLVDFHARSRKFENAHFDGLVVSKTYSFRLKSTEELCLMTLKSDPKTS